MTQNKKLNISDFYLNTNPNTETTESSNLNVKLQQVIRDDLKEQTPHVFDMTERVPRSVFEKNILSAMSNDKLDVIKLANEKVKIAEFDKKMKRIKKIKSRSYRKYLKKKKTSDKIEVPDFLLDKNEKNRSEKAFHNEELKEKVGKLIKIDLSDDESTDSEEEETKSILETKDKELENSEHFKIFKSEKQENIDEQKPKTTTTVLPGWGSWGGSALPTAQTRINTIETYKSGISNKKRKDFGMSRVLINEAALKNNINVRLPFGFTKSSYEAWLNVPVSRNAYSHKIFNRFVKSRNKMANQQNNENVETVEYKSRLDEYE